MSKLKPAVGPHDHLYGELSAPIQLLEFGDYECPYCGQAYNIVAALEQELGDQLCFAFRNFPLVSMHPHALLAAEAAEAANAQGQFWKMHDALYEHQDALELADLEELAALVGLDVPRFLGDLRSQPSRDKIRADLHSGAISGVNGTPTFFINGERHDGSYDFDSLLEALRQGRSSPIGFPASSQP